MPSTIEAPSVPAIRARVGAWLRTLGPGLITGAADDDPSGIATYSQAGAQFGLGMAWTMLFSWPLMCAIQLVSARIGRVTGHGLAVNMRRSLPQPLVLALVMLLFAANTVNIGADLAAMGAAAALIAGGFAKLFTAGFAALSLLLLLFASYERYVRLLKWLTLALFSYVAVVLIVPLDWGQVARAVLLPDLGLATTREGLTMLVAILGTTISPYLFFWQSAQEVEQVRQDSDAAPLLVAPEQARREIKRIKLDTLFGMAFSNAVALAIILAAAATLHARGVTHVATAADAAEALRPAAGELAFLLFTVGIVGTGMLAIPVLAGSAAYAVGEVRGWRRGLDQKPSRAAGFYTVIGLATLLGLSMDWIGLDPMEALVWAAVINGIVAVPMMVIAMIIVRRPAQMGDFTATWRLQTVGWLATGVMMLAVGAMLWTTFT